MMRQGGGLPVKVRVADAVPLRTTRTDLSTTNGSEKQANSRLKRRPGRAKDNGDRIAVPEISHPQSIY